MPAFSSEEAVTLVRSQTENFELVRNCYWDEDRIAACERFLNSGEFQAVKALLGELLPGGRVLDLGAGGGIASYAFAREGAAIVFALEPDPSDVVGRGAIYQAKGDLAIEILEGYGEAIPLPDQSVDVVYARAVLHHATDLQAVMRECERVLARGGLLLATREHVVDSEAQLQEFLRAHPLHHLTQSEHAYSLPIYQRSVLGAGLKLLRTIGPWDSVINAFPAVANESELLELPRKLLEERLGALGQFLAAIPFVRRTVMRRLNRPVPGRPYSFLATKPPADS